MPYKLDFDKIKQISITDVLKDLYDVSPVRASGDNIFYCAPWREDKNASLCVSSKKNIWNDLGAKYGGNVIHLVSIMEGISLIKAAEKLKEFRPSQHNEEESYHSSNNDIIKNNSNIKAVLPLAKQQIEYLTQRKIAKEIALKYCKTIAYTNNGKIYYSVGFESRSGGWELRGKNFKGCIGPKDITIIKGKIGIDVVLIEGFIDALSLLTYYKTNQLKSDLIVLNTLNNLSKTETIMKKYDNIILLLDNDPAGDKSTTQYLQKFKKATDKRFIFAPYKDFNDFLISKFDS